MGEEPGDMEWIKHSHTTLAEYKLNNQLLPSTLHSQSPCAYLPDGAHQRCEVVVASTILYHYTQ